MINDVYTIICPRQLQDHVLSYPHIINGVALVMDYIALHSFGKLV